MCPTRLVHKIEYLLDYGGEEDEFEVPDPYQGEAKDFELALDLIEDGCRGLLEYLTDQLRLRGQLPR
jgi:protein-tyrosine phosphatase